MWAGSISDEMHLTATGIPPSHTEKAMYVVVEHEIKDPEVAFPRGTRMMSGEGAPEGVRVLQFYPAQDGSRVTCLWESDSVAAVQDYVDATLGDASVNRSYAVDQEKAFAERPLGLPASPAIEA